MRTLCSMRPRSLYCVSAAFAPSGRRGRVTCETAPRALCWSGAGWGTPPEYGIEIGMLADGFDLKPSKTPTSDGEREAILKGNLGFGRLFTEHMVTMRYANGVWQRGELVPYCPITLDPAASALHYGQAIFEGFKPYRQPDGSNATFRPEANGKRF